MHAGVQATIADHTSGAAATTLLEPSQFVVTAEFKTNLLRAAKGNFLLCRAQVLKRGKLLIVVEAEVYVVSGTTKDFVSKTTATLSVMTTGK